MVVGAEVQCEAMPFYGDGAGLGMKPRPFTGLMGVVATPSFAHIWQRGVEPEGELQPCLPLPLPHIWLGGGANDDLLWACKSHAPPRPSLPIYGTGGETVRVGGATLPGPFMVKGRGQCE